MPDPARTTTATTSPAKPAAKSAKRQSTAAASDSMTTGATAQPIVPPKAWMLNARPMRPGDTEAERME